MVALGFSLAIVVGTILLMLPLPMPGVSQRRG